MTFEAAIRRCFENYANFNGRARRSEFWYFNLFTFLVSSAAGALISLLHLPLILGSVLSIVLLIPNLAVSFRRIHDIGKSGIYLLFYFIPIAGPILLLIWFVRDSQPGVNPYGVSEKYPYPGPGYF